MEFLLFANLIVISFLRKMENRILKDNYKTTNEYILTK